MNSLTPHPDQARAPGSAPANETIAKTCAARRNGAPGGEPGPTSRLDSSTAGLAGIMAVLVGGVVLLGWALDIPALKSVLPGWVAMKPNTAVAFVLIGLAVLFSGRSSPSTGHRPPFLPRLCGWLAGLIGLLSLAAYAFNWNPGFDQWLFPEPAGAVGTSHPGRMAPDTALCFMLFAAGWEFARRPRQTNLTRIATLLLGAAMITVALVEILSYYTPGLRISGWGGLTMMALPTATVFAALGAALVVDSWRIVVGPRLTRFSRNALMSAGLVVLLAAAFALDSLAEREINRATELRYRSYQLADELRQSGDDLTRMIRTYVATGDPVYKKHFQDILDIRDGRKPRPENYSMPYWDLVLGPAPRGSQPAVPLLELMRQAGFTDQELGKLAEAKANSDALTLPEFEAMKLVETAGPEAEANRARAVRMLYDDQYHQAKVAVMRPIHDFFVLLDQRTQAAVQTAERVSLIYRYLFGAIGLGLMFMLWRTYVALGDTLGGGVDEVYAHIARIGSGDSSSASTVKSSPKNSVLGWLAETQARLSDSDRARKQAEAALRESEREYRELFENSPFGIFQSTPDGRFSKINAALATMLGYSSPAEAIRLVTNIAEQHYAEPPRRDQRISEALGEGRYATIENTFRRVDGTRWIGRGSSRIVHGASGKPDRYEGFIEDITERKQAEAERQKLAMLADSSSEFIGMYDLDLKPHYVNPAGLRLVGLPNLAAACQVRVPDHFFPEDQRFIAEDFFPRVLRDGHADVEIRLRHFQTGEPIWMFYYLFSVRDASGTPVGWGTVSRDITDRRRADEKIRQSMTEVEEARQVLLSVVEDQKASAEKLRKLSAIIEQAPLSVVITDLAGAIEYVNPRFSLVTGYTLAEALGQNPRVLKSGLTPPEVYRAMWQTLNRGEVWSGELSNRTKSGELYLETAVIAPVFDGDGRATHYVALKDDITAKQRHEAELNAKLEREHELSEMKTRFISVTSHEFRTPMTTAMGSVEILANHLDRLPPEKRQELLGRIKTSLRRMTGMLDEILLLNRMDAQRVEVHPVPVDLGHFVRSLIDEVQLGDHDAHPFDFAVTSAAGLVVTDPSLLHHILSNLLINAVRYSPAGTVITVRIAVNGQEASIVVEDQGIGVPAKDRARIFDAFERGSNVGTIKGTGLGLSIVHRMTGLLGGTIALAAPAGGGTRFTLVLPALAATPNPA